MRRCARAAGPVRWLTRRRSAGDCASAQPNWRSYAEKTSTFCKFSLARPQRRTAATQQPRNPETQQPRNRLRRASTGHTITKSAPSRCLRPEPIPLLAATLAAPPHSTDTPSRPCPGASPIPYSLRRIPRKLASRSGVRSAPASSRSDSAPRRTTTPNTPIVAAAVRTSRSPAREPALLQRGPQRLSDLSARYRRHLGAASASAQLDTQSSRPQCHGSHGLLFMRGTATPSFLSPFPPFPPFLLVQPALPTLPSAHSYPCSLLAPTPAYPVHPTTPTQCTHTTTTR